MPMLLLLALPLLLLLSEEPALHSCHCYFQHLDPQLFWQVTSLHACSSRKLSHHTVQTAMMVMLLLHEADPKSGCRDVCRSCANQLLLYIPHSPMC